jgi:Ser/Thr protein kinase RdoA (MazF antagonist)
MSEPSHPYATLTPDVVMDAVESCGFQCSARILALNSYENRVYQVGLEDQPNLIAKFYRPQRWSIAQIQEEHDFSQALQAVDVPVVAPWRNDEGQSLFTHAEFSFALYPQQSGRAPDLEVPEDLQQLGRLLARLHAMGAEADFQVRPTLTVARMGATAVADVMASPLLPQSVHSAYQQVSEALLVAIEERFAAVPQHLIRLHGDCHTGNILWRDGQAFFVDLDDAMMGPAMQDLWLLLSGDRAQQQTILMEVLLGYEQFYDFPYAELPLIEPLRALRTLHYAAWLARRWDDPSFPLHFPWFGSERYWWQHIETLRQQLGTLEEPPLQL